MGIISSIKKRAMDGLKRSTTALNSGIVSQDISCSVHTPKRRTKKQKSTSTRKYGNRKKTAIVANSSRVDLFEQYFNTNTTIV